MIVGGGRRGVVAAACYVARTFGVRSAMPMFKALKACPDAVVVSPDIDKYRRVGREVRALMLELTPLVEPVSIDEAFLDLSGTERLHHASPAMTLVRFAKRVEDEIGITVSVGLSHNKFLAKLASDLEKPRGFSIIGRAETAARLADLPVAVVPGIGAAAQARLSKLGITHLRHVRGTPLADLTRLLGREAAELVRFSNGEDARPVRPERATKSVSAETTFDADLRGFEELQSILWRLCERVSRRLKAAGLPAAASSSSSRTRNSGCAHAAPRGCRRRSLPAGSTTRRSGCCGPNATAPPSASSASAPPICATPPRPIAATSPTPRWCATPSARRRSIVCARSSERRRSSAASPSERDDVSPSRIPLSLVLGMSRNRSPA